MTYNIGHGLQLVYGTFLSMGSICDLNRVLTDFMLSHIHDGDRVGIHLTGGKDTRVLLSILLKNNVDISGCLTCNHISRHPTVMKRDNDVSLAICKDLGLPYYHYDFGDLNELIRVGDEDFDVVFGGKIMGGILGDGFIWEYSLENTLDKFKKIAKHHNLVTPFIDSKVLLVCNRIPFYFKTAGIVHKKLLKLNYPALLRYPFTWRF